MRDFGYGFFLRYFAEGQPRRESLWAAGITELEADCALFDSFTDHRARELFLAIGVPLRLDQVEQGLALLQSGQTAAAAKPASGPDPLQAAVGRQMRNLQAALDKGDKTGTLKLAKDIRSSLKEANDQRYRAEIFCVAGEYLFKAGRRGRCCNGTAPGQRAEVGGQQRGMCECSGLADP